MLVHGIKRTAWSWLPVVRRLHGAARILAPDLRGHGASEVPRTGYEVDSLATDLLTVASAVGLGEDVGGGPFVVVGHGLGGMVAATMAALRPDSVAGVVLLDGGWEEVAEWTRQSPDELVAAMAEPPETLASMDAWLADRRSFDPATWDTDQEFAARSQVEEKYAGHVSLLTRPGTLRRLVEAMYAYRPLEVLSQVRCPLTIVVAGSGSADDDEERERLLAIDDVQRARQEAGRSAARVVRLRSGHDVVRHRSDEVAVEIASLLSPSPAAGGTIRTWAPT